MPKLTFLVGLITLSITTNPKVREDPILLTQKSSVFLAQEASATLSFTERFAVLAESQEHELNQTNGTKKDHVKQKSGVVKRGYARIDLQPPQNTLTSLNTILAISFEMAFIFIGLNITLQQSKAQRIDKLHQ